MCRECRDMYPYCPMCSPEPEWETCEKCNGSGRFWIDEEGNEYPVPDYGLEEETCPECSGTGVIEQLN